MEHKFEPLTKENVESFIGKPVEFTAPGYDTLYEGKAVIKSVDFSKRFPLECERLSGEDLNYAFLDNHGLVSHDGGDTYRVSDENTCFSYSDGYREVFIRLAND